MSTKKTPIGWYGKVYSMNMNTTFLQKLEILSYATEAKYISVEVLPIQSCFKVHHGFPIWNKSLKPTLQAARQTK